MSRSARRQGLTLALLALSAASLTGCGVAIPAGGALAAVFLGKKSNGRGVLVIRSQDTNVVLARGPFDLGDTTEGRGQTIVATQLELTATKAATLRSLTFSVGGTGEIAALPVRLYLDADKDGAIGASDAQLGTRTAGGGSVTFAGLDLALAQGAAVDFLVVVETPANAKDGDTFQVAVSAIESVDASVTNSAGALEQANVLGVPYTGGLKTISPTGSLRVFNGPNTPPSATAFTSAMGVPALQIELRASSVEPLRIETLALRASGTGDDSTAFQASLHVDADGDGAVDALDQPLASGVVASGDDGTLTFGGLALDLAAGEIARLLVVYDFTGAALDGQTFRVDLPASSGLTVFGVTSGNPIAASGTPLTAGATLTITRATLALGAGPLNGSRSAGPSATGVPVLQLTLSAGTAEPVSISSLGVQSSGSGHEPTGIAAVRLAVDANGNGTLDAGDTVLSGPLTYAADDGKVVFSGFQRTIAAGATETWLVLADVASVTTGGHQFTAALSGPGDILAVGQGSSLAVVATAPPVSGGTLTVIGSLTLAPGPNPPPAQTPFANAPDVPVLQLRAVSGPGEAVRITSITLRPSGTGDDRTGLASVELFLDADGSGTVTGPDVLVASGTFAANDSPLALSNPAGLLPGDLPPSSSADLLVRYKLSGLATAGDTFQAAIAPADLTAHGVSSGLAIGAGGTALASNAIVARRASLSIGPGAQNPTASGVAVGSANVAVLQVQVVAGPSEDANVSSVTLRASGTANDATAVSSVQLYLEGAGPLGALDGSDTQLGTGQLYAADDGSVAFTIAPALLLAAGSASNLLAVLQVSPLAPAGTTLVTRLTAADVTATGTTSGLSASVQGGTVLGPVKTLTLQPASQVALTSGDAQSGVAGSALASPFVVTVRDPGNNPVAGFTVTWAITGGGGSLTATNVLTDAAGRASTTLTLGTLAGANTVTATAAGLAGSPLTFNATGTAGAATQIVATSGGGQSAVVGTALGSPFVVTVRDANGNPVSNVPVAFNVTSGGGGVAPPSAMTDGAGQAATTLTLGTTAGTNQATASATGLAGSPVTFTATGTAASATQIALTSGDAQSGTVGAALVASFVVTVRDASNNPVPGTTVAWAVTGGGGSLSITSGPTDAAGQAATQLTLGTSAGPNTVTATSGSLAGSPVNFTATGTAGAATQIVLTSGNGQSGTAGAALAVPFVVTVRDANANPVSGTLVTFATSSGGSLSALGVTTNGAGQASSTLTLATVAGANTATASVTGLTGSPVTFAATGTAGSATQIAVASGNGQSRIAGTALVASFVALVRDANGNPVAGVPVAWLVTGGGGSLSAANATTDASGLAETLLTLGVTAGTNTVTASATGLAGSPSTFTATGTAGPATQIVLTSGSGQSAPAGATLLAPFVATVSDANGNPVSGVNVAWAVTGGGGSLSDLITSTDSAGRASSTLTLGAVPGPNTAQASASGLAGSPVAFAAAGTVGSTVTVVASQAVVIPPGTILPGDVERPMLQVHLAETSGTGGFDLVTLTVRASGTGGDVTDVESVKLWIDNPPLGVRDASDVQVGFSKYFADDGAVTFAGLLVPTVAANGAIDLLVTYDMADATKVTVNETYAARLASPGDLSVVSNPGAVTIIATGAFPLAGPTRTVTATTLTLSTGAASPTGVVNVRDSQALIPVLQLALAAGASGPVTVNGLNLTASGSANDATGVAAVQLYRDLDANGVLSAGDTLITRATNPFPVDNGKVAIAGLSETIPAGTTVHWLVVYDLANTAAASQTFQAFVAAATDVVVAAPGTVAGSFPVAAPGSRRTLNVVGGVSVALGPGNPQGTTLAAPSQDNPVLELTVTADAAEAMNVTALTITATGTTDFGPGGSFTAVKLFLDRNGNHTLETSGGSSDAPVLQSISSFTVGGKAAFTFSAITIPPARARASSCRSA